MTKEKERLVVDAAAAARRIGELEAKLARLKEACRESCSLVQDQARLKAERDAAREEATAAAAAEQTSARLRRQRNGLLEVLNEVYDMLSPEEVRGRSADKLPRIVPRHWLLRWRGSLPGRSSGSQLLGAQEARIGARVEQAMEVPAGALVVAPVATATTAAEPPRRPMPAARRPPLSPKQPRAGPVVQFVQRSIPVWPRALVGLPTAHEVRPVLASGGGLASWAVSTCPHPLPRRRNARAPTRRTTRTNDEPRAPPRRRLCAALEPRARRYARSQRLARGYEANGQTLADAGRNVNGATTYVKLFLPLCMSRKVAARARLATSPLYCIGTRACA